MESKHVTDWGLNDFFFFLEKTLKKRKQRVQLEKGAARSVGRFNIYIGCNARVDGRVPANFDRLLNLSRMSVVISRCNNIDSVGVGIAHTRTHTFLFSYPTHIYIYI